MSEQIHPKKDRNWLVYRHSIETDMRKGAASKAIIEYLDAVGYHQSRITPSMEFERGAMLAGFYNPNPRSQKTIITVDFVSVGGNTVIELVMRINRAGNMPLSKDFEFWEAEIRGIENSLHYGYCDPRLSEYAADRAKWYSIAIMLGIISATTLVTMLLSLVITALVAS